VLHVVSEIVLVVLAHETDIGTARGLDHMAHG
jgi:hypothetical protein